MVKAIRISSFNCRQTDRLLSKPDLNHKPANNQIESHPYLPQEELIKFCQSKGISVTTYAPVPWSTQLAMVLIQLIHQRNVSVIPKSVTPHHTEENFKVFDCELAKEEMKTFLTFKKQYRICALSLLAYLIEFCKLAVHHKRVYIYCREVWQFPLCKRYLIF
ncbi:aldo-keto reductase family 1 member B1-like [Cygnus olor]|uniref:aldo-keto reductase family 1 member B1-like n=1 Tax=Cygnus olor TaxID=8869 RepID=UPI001ADE7A7F|nr:aldo-keto reductase family 1 member B1-like [Cygnus olor]